VDVPRAELARLCREICVQCEKEAPRVKSYEEDFMRALAKVQEQHGLGSVNEETLWEIVSQEEKRVADAVVIAELLLPKLSHLLRGRAATSTPAFVPPPAATPLPPAENVPMARNAPLGVADLIQGMLDQDRKAPRP
jgi:hypothetical protein